MRAFIVCVSLLMNPFVFAAGPKKTDGVPPEKALSYLINGNLRFLKGNLRNKEGQTQKDVQRLANGQSPHTAIVSCSDSRVPPEIVFDQKLGELFVVRTAGQALDANVIGSLEKALELGTRLILVMGHTSCAAVTGALKTLDGTGAESPAQDELLQDLRNRLQEFKDKEWSTGLVKESEANAVGVAKDLIARSRLLRQAWEKGHVWIVPAIYDVATGKVTTFENIKPEGETVIETVVTEERQPKTPSEDELKEKKDEKEAEGTKEK